MEPDRNMTRVSSLIGRVLSRRGFLDEVLPRLPASGLPACSVTSCGRRPSAAAKALAARPGPDALPRQGAAGTADLLSRRGLAHRPLGPQAGTREARGRADAGRGKPAYVPGQERQPDAQPLAVRPGRSERQADLVALAAHGPARRRHRLLPRDDVEDEHARPRLRFHEHRAT